MMRLGSGLSSSDFFSADDTALRHEEIMEGLMHMDDQTVSPRQLPSGLEGS